MSETESESDFVPEEEVETAPKRRRSTRRKRKLSNGDDDTPPSKRKKETHPEETSQSSKSNPSQGSTGSKKRRQLNLSDSEDEENGDPPAQNINKATSWKELTLSSSEESPTKEESKPRRSTRSTRKKKTSPKVEEKKEPEKKAEKPKRTRKAKTSKKKAEPKKKKSPPKKEKSPPKKKKAAAKKKTNPKKKSPPKVKGSVASEKVLTYLQQQNRPFNYVQVFENLKKTVGKTDVKKILAKLAEEEKIGMVDLKGKLVYFALQPENEEITPEVLAELKDATEKTRERNREVAKERSALQSKLKSLRQYPSDAEVEKTIVENEEKIAGKDEALDKLKNGCNISADDMAKTTKEFEKLFKTWKKYKRVVKDMGDTFAGEGSKKPKKILEECGVETDEEVDVKITDWEELLPQKKRVIRTPMLRGRKRKFGR